VKPSVLWFIWGAAVACSNSANTKDNSVETGVNSDAGTINTRDAGAVDAFGCHVPQPGCFGCNLLGWSGSWYAPQLKNCQLSFPMGAGTSEWPMVEVVTDCEPRAVADIDAGLLWSVSLPHNVTTASGSVTVVDMTLILPSDICDLVKNNKGARVDVFAAPCGIAVMCGG